MFRIQDVIKILTRIFAKQNKRFPKGLEAVDIRLKAKEIHDVGKSQGYKGGISEDQLKQFLAFEKQAKPKEVIVKEAEIIDFPKERITDWTKPRPSKARGITELIEKGDITVGKAPKTQNRL